MWCLFCGTGTFSPCCAYNLQLQQQPTSADQGSMISVVSPKRSSTREVHSRISASVVEVISFTPMAERFSHTDSPVQQNIHVIRTHDGRQHGIDIHVNQESRKPKHVWWCAWWRYQHDVRKAAIPNVKSRDIQERKSRLSSSTPVRSHSMAEYQHVCTSTFAIGGRHSYVYIRQMRHLAAVAMQMFFRYHTTAVYAWSGMSVVVDIYGCMRNVYIQQTTLQPAC